MLGEEGNDSMYGDMGNDRMFGMKGGDQIWGGDGEDTLVGSAGMDKLIGDAGDDTAWGGAGDDGLLGNEGSDRLIGGDGNDSMWGGNDGDLLLGGADNDLLIGDLPSEAGNDKLYGETGDDRLFDAQGDDHLDGGSDLDSCYDDIGANTVINCEEPVPVSVPAKDEAGILLANLKVVTDKYHGSDVAIAGGYMATDSCVPEMGYHYVNASLASDLDVAELVPEVVLYEPAEDDSSRKLVGVEIFAAALANTTGGPAPWFEEEAPPMGWYNPAQTLFAGQCLKAPWRGMSRECRGTMTCMHGSGRTILTGCLHRSTPTCPAARPFLRCHVGGCCLGRPFGDLRFAISRQGKRERSAALGVVFSPDPAAVRLDDAL